MSRMCQPSADVAHSNLDPAKDNFGGVILLIRMYFPHKQNYKKNFPSQLLGHTLAESKMTIG